VCLDHPQKEMFGLSNDVILGAVYMRTQSNQFTADEVRDHYSNLFDELARASQVTPNVLLCGDFNAKIGNLCEVTDAHASALVDCPALQHPRREYFEKNATGKMLVNIVVAFELIFTTGQII